MINNKGKLRKIVNQLGKIWKNSGKSKILF